MSITKEQAQQTIKALIFDELQTYNRFNLWVEANYQIHVFMNDEDKRIEVKVIERDMSLAQEALAKSVKELVDKNKPTVEVFSADILDKLDKPL